MYLIRGTAGHTALAITFKGALAQLAMSTPDAAVHTLTGRWIAGRRIGG